MPPDELHGREREIDECSGHLARSRGLWIRGGPGVGKSALARALAGSTKKRKITLIDDADDRLAEAEEQLRAALGRGGSPVVVTARSRPRLASIPVHVVQPLSSEETAALLAARMEALVPGWEPPTSDEASWAELGAHLNGAPLVVEVVAGLLRDHSIAEVLSWIARGDVVDAPGAADAAHHTSLARAIAWQLDTLPPEHRAALRAIARFRARVPYELVLRAAREGGADARRVVTELMDASLLESGERSGRWVTPWIATVLERHGQDAERARAEATHAEVVAAAAREHVERRHGPLGRALAAEDLALAATHRVRSGGLGAADEGWLRALLDETEVGLATREAPEPVHALVEVLEGDLPPEHPLHARARVARAGRAALLEPSRAGALLETLPEDGDEMAARRALLETRAAWMCGALNAVDELVERGVARARAAGMHGHAVALLTACGAAQALRGDAERATTTLERALEEALAAGDDAYVAHVELRLGNLAAELGRVPEAQLRLEEARRLAERAGHARLAWLAECDLAVIPLERGSFAQVATDLAACERRALPGWRGATIVFYQALALELAGQAVEASRAYARTLVRARQTGNRLIEAMAHALRARLSATYGELDGAERDAAEAERLFVALDDPTHGALADLARGHLELARAATKPGERAALLASAAARLARHRTHDGAAARSFDVRLAVNALGAALEANAPPSVKAGSASAIVVERSGRYFQLPFGERTSIDTRGSMRRILAELARDRLERPGRARSPEEIFTAGWPGERCHPSSAQARVYVAISSLRKLGLREVIRRAHDGYFLDPDVEVRVVEG